jgi:hypothetical protein
MRDTYRIKADIAGPVQPILPREVLGSECAQTEVVITRFSEPPPTYAPSPYALPGPFKAPNLGLKSPTCETRKVYLVSRRICFSVEVALQLLPDSKILEHKRWRNVEAPDGLGACLLCCGPQIALEGVYAYLGRSKFKQLPNLKVVSSDGAPTN